MNEDSFLGKRRRSDEEASGYPPSLGSVGPPTSNQGSDKWSEDLHRFFVAAIYDAGVSQSSPSVLLENMTDPPAALTSERVKSHLQKYRKNKQKSKEDFMSDYDSFMRKAMTVGGAGANANHVVMPPSAMIEMMGGGKPSGGDVAAFLSYSVMTEGEVKNTPGTTISSAGIAKESQDYLKIFAGTHVPFPQLTEEEKQSPLGISMVYVMGLFSSLSQHMLQERRKRARPQQERLYQATVAASMNRARAINMTMAGQHSGNSSVGAVVHQQQQQYQNLDTSNLNNSGMPWLAAAATANRPPFLAQHINIQHGGISGVASTSSIPGDIMQQEQQQHGQPPGNPSGLFYPILTKGDLDESKGAMTDWRAAALQQEPGIPGLESAPTPNRDSISSHGSDSYTPV